MTRTPPKPPRSCTDLRRDVPSNQPVSKPYRFGSDDVGPMFWAAVAVLVVLAAAIVALGGPA